MKAARSARAVTLGAIFFLIAYVTPQLISIPLPWYLPLAREWIFTVKPSTLGMGWYGQTAAAIVAGSLGATLGWLLPNKRGAVSPAGGWALVLVTACVTLLVGAVYVHELVDRVPKPEPLPS